MTNEMNEADTLEIIEVTVWVEKIQFKIHGVYSPPNNKNLQVRHPRCVEYKLKYTTSPPNYSMRENPSLYSPRTIPSIIFYVVLKCIV
jgi:hypothetical protein